MTCSFRAFMVCLGMMLFAIDAKAGTAEDCNQGVNQELRIKACTQFILENPQNASLALAYAFRGAAARSPITAKLKDLIHNTHGHRSIDANFILSRTNSTWRFPAAMNLCNWASFPRHFACEQSLTSSQVNSVRQSRTSMRPTRRSRPAPTSFMREAWPGA